MKLESIKRYQKKVKEQKGRPKIWFDMCKDIGLSDEVSMAIAMDGYTLDDMMQERGITRKRTRKRKITDYWKGGY